MTTKAPYQPAVTDPTRPESQGPNPYNDPTVGGLIEALVRRSALGAQPPKDFAVIREGSGVRLLIQERDKLADRSATITYVFGCAQDVDTSTKTGLDAGEIRAAGRGCGQVSAPPKLDDEATDFIIDSRYQSGTFYCWGVDATGGRSDYLWSQLSSGDILDTTVPADFTHFDASESGEEVTPGVIDSVLTVTGRAPIPLGSLDGPQIYLGNYTSLGSIEESDFRRYTGPPGGSITFKVPLQLVRRKGTGIISVTNGSPNITVTGGALLSQAQGGDQLELFGLRFFLNTPSNNTTVVLTANWTGPSGSFTDWKIVPLVTVYFVAVSKGGTRRPDVTNAPSRLVLFDGDLSAPVAPTILAATAMGNTIRIDVEQPIGTGLAFLHLWRGTGVAVAFASCVEIDSMKLDNSLPFTSSGVLQFEDSKFSVYERGVGQVFTYYCTVTNYRRDSSLPSAAASTSARLNSSQDGDPTLPSRDGFKNLFFDGFIGGTGVTTSGVANVVDDSDATQDAFNFNPAIAPSTFAASSGTRLQAWTRWKWHQDNQITVFPVHVNNNEIKLAPPGAGKQVGIKQSVHAWDNATTIDHKLQKGQYVTVQVKIYPQAGVTPDGTFSIVVNQFNGVTATVALLRSRLPDDSLLEVAAVYNIAASTLVSGTAANPIKIFATFHLNAGAATDRVEVRFIWDSGTVSNLFLKEAMENDGTELAPWTADMGNIDIYYPVAGNPSGAIPIDGSGTFDLIPP